MQGEELDRFELRLSEAGGDHYTGYTRVGTRLEALPIGEDYDTGIDRPEKIVRVLLRERIIADTETFYGVVALRIVTICRQPLFLQTADELAF